MAKLLKKRALAEYSQVIQEEPKPPQKRLKLTHKPKQPEPQLDLHSATSSYEVMQMLLRFASTLPLDVNNVETVLRALLEQFYKEKEAPVRAKIASLLGDIAKTPGLDLGLLVDDVTSILKTEVSHRVLSQLIHTIQIIGRTLPQDTKLHKQLIDVAVQHLSDGSHLVRCKCMELIGALGSPDMKVKLTGQSEESSLQTILGEYTQDHDSRVRTSAFQAMLTWHQRGLRLDQSQYNTACTGLTDDYEGVRRAAVKLIWVLSHLYPESLVPVPDSQEELRLVDDCFVRICNMVNDLSMKVRTEAAGLLGSLHLVSSKFLEQTLDKKLMSNMRRKRSAHERQKEHFQTGEWSTGKKLAEDIPAEEVDPENVQLMSSGACGAFVHGLEDEFLEVRNAAIDSLCELAMQSSTFATLSQDFLVDMFNDEIDSVRLNAIYSLCKISKFLVLREDQMEIILGVLKDYSYEIREGLHEMLCFSHLGTKACLNACALGLLENMKRYPQDRASIWRCMQHLGQKHPSLVLQVVPELLSGHPYFDTPEPEMDDPAYIGVLLLVFNAAKDCPTMLPLFPDHTFRHYAYLRDTLPDLVPVLKMPGCVVMETKPCTDETAMSSSFLSRIMTHLESLVTMDTKDAQQLMQIALRDLHRVREVEPSLSATAECLSIYIQCQLKLIQLLGEASGMAGGVACLGQQDNTYSALQQVLKLTQHIECLFIGLSRTDLAAVHEFRLQVQALQLMMLPQNSSQRTALSTSLVDQLNALSQQTDITHNPVTQSLLSNLPKLNNNKPDSLTTAIQAALKHHRPSVLKLTNKVQRAHAVMTEPVGSSDNPIKFTAGLTVAVPLVVMIENVKNLQNVRIQLRYPDMSTELVVPKSHDFRQLGPLRHRLVSEVLLSHALWSESCSVEVGMVLCSGQQHSSVGLDVDLATPSTSKQQPGGHTIVELCKPVKVYIAPKPAKR